MGTRRGKFAVLALLLTAALAVFAPVAGAAGEPDTGGFGAFRLKASNGYEVLVLAASKPGFRNGEVLILVSRRGSFVSYYAPATVTDTRIDAELGTLGRIDVEFEPSGSRETVRSQCDPDAKLTYDKGSYVGTVELRGEEGYTEATATRVAFWPRFYVDFGCMSVGYGEFFGPHLPGARLLARKRTEGGSLALQVNQNRPHARVSLIASIEERRGPIQIDRQVEAVDSGISFFFHPNLRSAVLRPEDPFSGRAVFRRDAKKANRWTGTLSVDFPGRSDVPLAGPGFRTSLRHARFTKEVGRDRNRLNLLAWPSTKPSPTASATSSLPAPS
ncbi:MAG TPA: hypothetical protein VFT79_08580 [Solirubrobacterales bacterium]|nr:hypothetical protein [Solirubrobacterales bacterium]